MAKDKTKVKRSVLEARDGELTARFLILANNNGVYIPPELHDKLYKAAEVYRKRSTQFWGHNIQNAATQSFARLTCRSKPAALTSVKAVTDATPPRSVLAARDIALVSAFTRTLRANKIEGVSALKPIVLDDLHQLRARSKRAWGFHIWQADKELFSDFAEIQIARKKVQAEGHKPAVMKARKRPALKLVISN